MLDVELFCIISVVIHADPVMTKLQNLFVALENMDIFQLILKFSLFTIVISVETL